MTTARLSLPEMTEAQGSKYLTHNEALKILDAVVQASCIELGRDTPPGSPTIGDSYVVGSSPTGAWVGLEDYLVVWDGSIWVDYAPAIVRFVFNQDTNHFYFWDAGSSPDQWSVYQGPVATTFTGLLDTFASYTGKGGQVLRVNIAENAVESVDLEVVEELTPGGSPLSITPNIPTGARTYCAYVTAISGNLTINNPSGTPANFQTVVVRLKSAAIRTLSFDTEYRASSSLALPAATSGGNLTDYFSFMYNGQDSKWDILAANMGF